MKHQTIGERAADAIIRCKTEAYFLRLMKAAKKANSELPDLISSFVNAFAAYATSKLDQSTYEKYRKTFIESVNLIVRVNLLKSLRFRILIMSKKKE